MSQDLTIIPAETKEIPTTNFIEKPHVHGPNCSHSHHQALPFQRTTEKVGRNDACPCGSGNKFKKCCA